MGNPLFWTWLLTGKKVSAGDTPSGAETGDIFGLGLIDVVKHLRNMSEEEREMFGYAFAVAFATSAYIVSDPAVLTALGAIAPESVTAKAEVL